VSRYSADSRKGGSNLWIFISGLPGANARNPGGFGGSHNPAPGTRPSAAQPCSQSSALRFGVSHNFRGDAPGNCLQRIETLRVPAVGEKREHEAKTGMKIRV